VIGPAVLIADTSAWVDFLSGTGSPETVRLRQAISEREAVVIDPILLEVTAGASRDMVVRTQRLLESQQIESMFPRLDRDDASGRGILPGYRTEHAKNCLGGSLGQALGSQGPTSSTCSAGAPKSRRGSGWPCSDEPHSAPTSQRYSNAGSTRDG